MAGKKFNVDDMKEEFTAESLTEVADKKKKPNSDFIRLDLKPFGYDLKDYADKKAAALSIERGKRVSTTAFIQELIIAAMENDNGTTKKKEKQKETKKEKIIRLLEEADDSKLQAIFTLLDIQL